MSETAPRRASALALVAAVVTAAVCAFALPHAASGQSPAPKVVPGNRVFHIPADAVVVKTDLGLKDGAAGLPPLPKGAKGEKVDGQAPVMPEPIFGKVYRILKGGVIGIDGSHCTFFVEPGGVLKVSRGPHAIIVKKGGKVILNNAGAHIYLEKGADIKDNDGFPYRTIYDSITFAALPLKPFTLRGSVSDRQGRRAAKVKVHAFGLAREHLGTQTTDAEGTFALAARREVIYLAADLGSRWAKEAQPGNSFGLEQRQRNRVVKGWEAEVVEGSWVKDADIALVHSNRGVLDVRELGKLPGVLQHSFHGGIVFAPGREQAHLLATASETRVQLWDLKTGQQLHRLLEVKQTPGKLQKIAALTFAPDGATVAASGPDKVVRLWRTATGEKLHELGHKGEPGALTFTPDGRQLLSGAEEGAVITWDVATGRELRRFKAHEGTMHALVFGPHGKTLLTAGDVILKTDMITFHKLDLLRLWDVASGRELRKFSGPCNALVFSPDGSLLVVGGVVHTTHSPAPGVWQTRASHDLTLRSAVTGAEVLRLPSSGTQAVFSPDGRLVLTVGYGGVVQFWEVATGEEVLRVPLPVIGAPAVTLAPGGARVAAADTYTGTVTVWDLDWESLHALQPLKAPKGAERDALWTALGGADAAEAYRAIRALAAGRDDTVAFLRERLRPAPVKDLPFARLIGELNSDRFAVRQAASAALVKIGTEAEQFLRQALAEDRPLEAQRRIEAVLAELQRRKLTEEDLRPLRAVALLERIDTAEARKLIEALAAGWPAARQTREAQAALQRRPRKH
jgi:WD40 repeat protein